MKTILVIGCKDQEEIFPVLEQQRFSFRCVETHEAAVSALSSKEYAAVLLDLDAIPVTSPMIRNLAATHPGIPFLCISRKRLHPELREAFHDHIYACLAKPVDPEELRYWLKSLWDREPDPRAPP
ncbi:MAG: hypothetical protein JRJ54_10155 [Deltaproteobacteria bacterium]|nr:hypothetical protein [Deltaproteobacteria bacterium]